MTDNNAPSWMDEEGPTPESDNENKTESKDETPADQQPESEDQESESEKDKDAESETEQEKDPADLTKDDLRALVEAEEDIPDGVNEDRLELARTELKLEAKSAEADSMKAYVQANPDVVLTDEQKAEVEEVRNTKGMDSAVALYNQYKEEAMQKTLNNPEQSEKLRKAYWNKEYAAFLKETKMTAAEFKEAVTLANKQKLETGKMSIQDFLKKTHEVHAKTTGKKIHPGQTPPKLRKGGRSVNAPGGNSKPGSILDAMME